MVAFSDLQQTRHERAPCRWWRPAGFCSNNSLFYQQTCMISVHTHIETELYIQYSSIIYHYLSFFWYAYRNLELTYPCSKNQEGMWTVTRIALKCIKMPHLTAGVFCSRWLFNLPFRKICILALHSELEIHSHLQESMALRQTGRNLPAYTNMGTFTTSYGGFLHGTYRFTKLSVWVKCKKCFMSWMFPKIVVPPNHPFWSGCPL